MLGNKVTLWASVLFALLGILITGYLTKRGQPIPHAVQGRNNTVLFLTNQEDGVSNVFVAAATALYQNHPDIEVHYASFPRLGKKLTRLTSLVRSQTAKDASSPRSDDIIFHAVSSASPLRVTMASKHLEWAKMIHPPGVKGAETMVRDVRFWSAAWNKEDHLALYHEFSDIIREVDPAVVVLDVLLLPAVDATRAANRLHSFISPNLLVLSFFSKQPWGGMFWKYPFTGSGFPFPLPLRLVAQNIYLTLRILLGLFTAPGRREKRDFLIANGIENPQSYLGFYRPDTPWITQEVPQATIPLDYVPENVTIASPISINLIPVEEQDIELVAWLKKGPTILVNLGTTTLYNEERTTMMLATIIKTLDAQSEFQVLWKYLPEKEFEDREDLFEPAQPYVQSGRLIITKWLTVDPPSLLDSGLIHTSVHHGGAVPQIVLPFWWDHYSFAQLVDQTGVGVWACRETSPDWTSDCLGEAFAKVIYSEGVSESFRLKAKDIGDTIAQRELGRDTAAKRIAQLARSGK
ncbi:hypothetical protein BX600DRAFT_488766 [Xylariales sp. PMI_506]|nr:hypothetical protein BX600DRAFT_488766 [Xylariales sp. PMI_506]